MSILFLVGFLAMTNCEMMSSLTGSAVKARMTILTQIILLQAHIAPSSCV